MKKNIVLLLLTVLVVQFCICSCTYYTEDPFLTETDNGTTDENFGKNEIETDVTQNTEFQSRRDDYKDRFGGLFFTFPNRGRGTAARWMRRTPVTQTNV